jgi:hypothetical protein
MNSAKILVLISCIGMAGCNQPAEIVSSSTNPKVPVETLFSHEGCTVYRFYDGGRNHYFARCPGVTETVGQYSQTCGKGCVRTESENIGTYH